MKMMRKDVWKTKTRNSGRMIGKKGIDDVVSVIAIMMKTVECLCE